MGGLSRSAPWALLLLFFATPASAQVDRWSAEIGAASARFQIPETWIRQVMQAESAGRTELNGRMIVSRAGAMGLMQLMPATWLEMRAAHGLGADPFNPRDNILAGAAYLRAMHDRFGYPGLFGAYNAGPRRYAEHVQLGSRLPLETRVYLAKVTRGALKPPAASHVDPKLVFTPGHSGQGSDAPLERTEDRLFAIRR